MSAISARLSDDRDARARGGPVRHAFTVAEYYRMAETGVLPPTRRTELIDGDIIEMSPIGTKHAACVTRLHRTFSSRLAPRADVRVQQPVRLNDESEPEPDLALVARRADDYETAHPAPADVLLLIEVSDTTLAFDRQVKAALYARAGIVEYWVVDVVAQVVEVHRAPAEGRYGDVAAGEDSLSPVAFPDVRVSVAEVFGPGVEASAP